MFNPSLDLEKYKEKEYMQIKTILFILIKKKNKEIFTCK